MAAKSILQLLGCWIIPLLLWSCAGKSGTTGSAISISESKRSLPAGNDLAGKNEQTVLIDLNPRPKDNYQTVDKDGVEWRQGRFLPGNHGGKLIAAVCTEDPKSFNPWTAEDSFSLELCDLLFRGLADVDVYTGEIIPDLAAKIDLEKDGLTYIVRLRKGLRWSDGKNLSAEDVAFTWNKILSQGYGNLQLRESALVDGKLPACTVLDELTCRFVTAKPYEPFRRILAGLKIAPKHVVEPVLQGKDGRSGFKSMWTASADLSRIVGSGPFSVLSYEPGVKIEFARSDCFYMIDRNGSTLPYLDRLVYLIVSDSGASVLAFGKNEADLGQFRPRDLGWLAGQQLKQNFRLHNLGPSSSSSFLVFNLNKRLDSWSKKAVVDPVKSAWFNDRNFRQAVNHALDRNGILKDFFKGAGLALYTFEPGNSLYFNNSLKTFDRDAGFAQELLYRSGFLKKDDGLLYDKDGNRVEFTLSFAEKSHMYENIAKSIKASLKELGITVNLEPLEMPAVDEVLKGARTWESQLICLSLDPVEPAFNSNLVLSNGRLHVFDQRDSDRHGDIQVSDARDWETRIDEIYALACREFDSARRKALYAEAQRILYDEVPLIPLVSPDVLIGARNTICNFAPSSLSQSCLGLHNVEEIYIDSRRKPQEKQEVLSKTQ